jgi:hypothetical protein
MGPAHGTPPKPGVLAQQDQVLRDVRLIRQEVIAETGSFEVKQMLPQPAF